MTPEVEEKIVHMRTRYHLDPDRIYLFIQRYHPSLQVSASGGYSVLRRLGLNHLTNNTKRRTVRTCRYEKQVPGHHIQVDVKFLSFKDETGKKIRRFQYTAIDDSTRIRALQIHDRHNQATAVTFIDYVVEKFPFRIQTVCTDNGHEFQA